MERYLNRYQAGKIVAEQLQPYANNKDVIVLALPRGGVPVAYEIAHSLNVPLDVYIVRKLGMPQQEELAFGAIAMDGTVVYNEDILEQIPLTQTAINQVIHKEQQELERRMVMYRGNRHDLHVTDKTIILVDDGIATGATMRAAIKALRQQKPTKIIIAVPVAAESTVDEMKKLVEEIACPLTPEHFYAVGAWYEDFTQTTDEEVSDLLHKAR